MKLIALRSFPSQTLRVVLSGQNCKINVYEKSSGLFLDLYVSDQPIVTTVLCHDRVRLIREEYRNFVGDLIFCDTQGTTDPTYPGFGGRYVLYYLEAADL